MQATAKLVRELFHRKLESSGNIHLHGTQKIQFLFEPTPLFFFPLTCPSSKGLLAEAA